MTLTSTLASSIPRILCLHGGGTNANIFTSQCRRLIAALPEYRLVFAEAPHPSHTGPDVTAVYGDRGPFKRWLRWLPEQPEMTPAEAATAIDESLYRAMADDAGTGEWVAILGFSQGAKVAASVLYRQQSLGDKADTRFRFGVLCAGRGPLFAFDDGVAGLPDASQIADPSRRDWALARKLEIPTLHVHGLFDEGLEYHRLLKEDFCDAKVSTVVEWQGGHRMPLKTADIEAVTNEIRRLAVETNH